MDVEDSQLSTGEIEAMARRIDRPVVLVGMMGVGKSSVGKRLAALFHWPFFDADDEIERAAQMTIPEIFATHGEAYFRDGERRVIARLLQQDGQKPGQANSGQVNPGQGSAAARCIIATGGGAFVNAETRALILDRAVAVWLDSDIDTLVDRTSRKDNRPLLQQGDPRETLTRLREERRPAYEQAPIHVVSGSGPHGRTIAKVLQGIGQWL